ncbi:MAG: glycosyltransferase family 9 protein [Calditrichia bacterium]
MVKTDINRNQIKKILIIQFRPFGDVLLTTSVFSVLKEAFTEAELHFLVNAPYHSILEHNRYLDKVIVKTSGIRFTTILKEIRTQQYDLVLDYINSNQSALVTLFSGARYKCGYRKDKLRDKCYNILGFHPTKRYSAWMKFDLLKPLGVEKERYELSVIIPQRDSDFAKKFINSNGGLRVKHIIISPNSPRPHKRWRPSYFAKVAEELARHDQVRVYLLEGPGEKEYVDLVESFMNVSVKRITGLTIMQLIAVLKEADLYIGNCGGPKHMAVAVNTPTITIFGPTDPVVWHPNNLPQHVALINQEKRFIDDTFGINPVDVLQMAYQLLNIKS